jgi:aspartate--ammonia ligase
MQKSIQQRLLVSKKLRTEQELFELKDYFKQCLKRNLNLFEVSAPLFVTSGTGINDDLNGIEKPVRFIASSYPDRKMEIVQSLAKWKRLKIKDLELEENEGIITDMKAIRPDEIISPIHSIFVDQWDWEKRISARNRNLDYLKNTVKSIYKSMKETEGFVMQFEIGFKAILPEEITFIHSEELQYRYPKLTPKEREDIVAQDYGAVFIIGIGHELADGIPHDLRAPDYDDWSTQISGLYKGLNGDIIVWNPILKKAFEISSMGIRVNAESLIKQLKITNAEHRKELMFHQKVLNNELPLTIGGGIGQSRLAMLLLKKQNILEVQTSF